EAFGERESERRMVTSAATDGAAARGPVRSRAPSSRVEPSMARRGPLPFVVAIALAGTTAASARGADDLDRPPAAGRVFWLRADLGVTKGISDLVTAWNDAATAAPLLVNAYTNALPEWRAAVIGGQPALHFDGNDFLYGGGMPTGSYTKVAVC